MLSRRYDTRKSKNHTDRLTTTLLPPKLRFFAKKEAILEDLKTKTTDNSFKSTGGTKYLLRSSNKKNCLPIQQVSKVAQAELDQTETKCSENLPVDATYDPVNVAINDEPDFTVEVTNRASESSAFSLATLQHTQSSTARIPSQKSTYLPNNSRFESVEELLVDYKKYPILCNGKCSDNSLSIDFRKPTGRELGLLEEIYTVISLGESNPSVILNLLIEGDIRCFSLKKKFTNFENDYYSMRPNGLCGYLLADFCENHQLFNDNDTLPRMPDFTNTQERDQFCFRLQQRALVSKDAEYITAADELVTWLSVYDNQIKANKNDVCYNR
jgi:hypothetical protein